MHMVVFLVCILQFFYLDCVEYDRLVDWIYIIRSKNPTTSVVEKTSNT